MAVSKAGPKFRSENNCPKPSKKKVQKKIIQILLDSGSVAANIEYPEIKFSILIFDFRWYHMSSKIEYILPKIQKNREEHI